MSTNLGFGKQTPQNAPKLSKRLEKRNEAAQQLDKMRADGVPEYEVYIRVQGKKQWYPVGAIAVKRSSQINQAIFGSQQDLLQGAFRLFPILRKNQNQLEYGYRLKEYKDEPIQVAVPPQQKGANAIQSVVSSLQQRLASLTPKRS
ncbi:HHL1-like protein [Leptolyngbya sp. AN02str]|uniref:HHL1-like protein n=1 Tax=Leptolyngbya sp. AN02str TaxID=3423363 RepID=UPI003D3216B1